MRLICSCVVTALSLTLFACGKTSTTKQSVSGSSNSEAGSTNPRITLENVKQIKQGMTLQEMEKRLIIETLQAQRNNRTKTAEVLGISVRTLRNKIHEYNLQI